MDYVQLARQFFVELGASSDGARATIRKFFTDTTRWENVGLLVTTGADEAIRFHDDYEKATGLETITADIKAIAAQGNVVLMERTDTFRRGDGSLMTSFPCMCAMEFEGEKLVAWRDYYDTVPFQKDVK